LRLGQREDDIYEESVAAASKGAALSPLEAPNSVTIITQQDIRLSGMTKLSDLFRRVAGIDIMDVTNGYADMSMRGFNQRMSNKLLVLVDGRSVQSEFFGNTFYDWLTIDVDQIDRIEIVRGPGSALYGADAFSGVVNIVTRAPGTGGNSIRVGAGPLGEAYGSLRTAGRNENLAYRMSAGYNRTMRWSRQAPNGRVDIDIANPEQDISSEAARFDFRSERRFSKDVSLGLAGGYSDVFYDFYSIGVFRGFQQQARTGFVQTNLRAHELSLRVAYTFNAAFDNQSAWNYRSQTRYKSNLTTDVLDSEFVYADDFKTGSLEHVINLGINYKYRKVVSTFTDEVTENFFGFFGQETLKVSPLLTFVASGRLDYLPYTEKWETSPRLSVLVHPTERSTIRGSFSTAFRKPTALEGYMQLGVQSTSGSVQALNDSTRAEQLEPERILNAEIGYISQDIDWLALDTALYYNRVTDLVVLAPNEFVTPSDRLVDPLYDQNTGRYIAAFSRFTNQCANFNVFGGEVGARVFPLTGLDLFANYALNHVSADRPPGCDIPDDKRTSAHKINAGVQVRTKPGIDGEVSINHVTSQVWSERIVNAAGEVVSQDFPLDPYTLLNARLGYRFLQDRFELSAMGFNLLNDKHKEHPFTQTVGRRFMTFAQYNF
jgi:iron complex outermembrane receptor protein